MKKTLLGFLSILITLLSCKESPKKDISSIEPVSQPSPSGKYSLDTSVSKVNWTGYMIKKSLNLSHFGTLQFKEGTLDFSENKLKGGIFTVDLSSLEDEDIEDSIQKIKLIKHLKEKDFLDAEIYPVSVFTIMEVKNIEGVSDYNSEIRGTLKIKDIAKDISVKANIRTEEGGLFLNTEKFTLNRQDFGMKYKGREDAVITDDFDLQISIIARSN